MHNRRGQLREEHRCADIYRRPRGYGDGPRWHYSRPHTDKLRPHSCNPRQRRRRCHPSDSLQDRVRHRQKGAGAGEVARAVLGDRTGRSLRGKGGCVRNPYGRAASLLASLLLAHGYGLYCIDHTQDFSGVLDREALVDNLCASEGFREQGDLASAMRADVPTILANTGSVGGHVCTWVRTSKAGYTVRMKLYNKVVSRRARSASQSADIWPTILTVRTCICAAPSCIPMYWPGAALASKSLCTPAAGGGGGDLSADTAKEVVAEALALVSPSDLPEEQGLFVAQPPAKQWENMALCLDRCLVLVDRPQGSIFVAWYAHTTTCRVTKANADKEETWERAVEWAAADFRFRACPIFRVDILGANVEGVELGPLRCYTKDADAGTNLVASKRPTQLHPNGPDPRILLPPSAMVSWVWRANKCHAVGIETSAFHLQEVPEIAQGRAISTLSTRNREKRLQHIRDSANAEGWRRRAWARLEAEQRQHEEEQRCRAEEMERLSQLVAGYRRYAEKSQQARVEVEDTLRTQSGKVTDIPSGRKRLVLGYKRSRATTAPSYVALLRSNNRRQLPSNCLWCVGNPGARKVTRLVRRRLRVGHGQIRENNLLAFSRWRFQALGAGD